MASVVRMLCERKPPHSRVNRLNFCRCASVRVLVPTFYVQRPHRRPTRPSNRRTVRRDIGGPDRPKALGRGGRGRERTFIRDALSRAPRPDRAPRASVPAFLHRMRAMGRLWLWCDWRQSGTLVLLAASAGRVGSNDPMFLLLANRDEVSVSKQKRDAIAALLQENPQRSDRAIAKQAKVSHHTVAKVRTEMKATGRTGQSAQSAVPSERVGLDGKVRKVSHGKVRAEIEANEELSHKDDGRTEVSGHQTRGRKPKPPAAVRDARGSFIRSPQEPEARAEQVNRQPPDHADDG